MPSIEQLEKTDQEHAVAIAELRARIDGHDETLTRHERHMGKLDEAIGILREASGRVATKDDIAGLQKDFSEKFDQRLSEAQSSIPGKIAVLFGGGMFFIALVGLIVDMMHGHG
jgi:chromosome segregation ATPase